MLMMKAPIQLKIHSPIHGAFAGFGERILHNYGMISTHMEPEDLLHAVTAPPEIYITEGGSSSLHAETEVRNSQEWKLQVINNVLNRIVIADTRKNTYQDMVYISSVLRKLGIRNEQRFVKQVRELRDETRNTSELINLYWSYTGAFRELIEQVTEGRNRAEEKEQEQGILTEQERYYIQETIYKRLQTAANYQLLQTCYQLQSETRLHIAGEALRLAEQGRMSSHMLLQKLKNVTLNENKALIYHHINTYEIGEEAANTELTEQTVIRELASAILLNLVDNINTVKQTIPAKSRENWFQVNNALYQSADNTLVRYEGFHREVRFVTRETRNYLSQVNNQSKQEISVLREFVTNTLPLYYQMTEVIDAQGENTILSEITENRIAGNQYRNQSSQTLIENNTAQLTEQLNLINRQEHTEDMIFSSVEEQVAFYEEKNRLVREQVQKMDAQTPKVNTVRVDRERARRDSLRALEDPQTLIQEYLEENTRLEQLTGRAELQYESMLSRETREIFDRLAAYHMSPAEAAQQGIITEGAEAMLQTELADTGRMILEYPEMAELNEQLLQGVTTENTLVNTITSRIYENLKNGQAGAVRGSLTEAVKRGENNTAELPLRETRKLIEAAGARLVFAEEEPGEEQENRIVSEVITGVERVIQFYRVNEVQEQHREIHMIHKNAEQELDEEILQEILQHKTEIKTQDVTEQITHNETGQHTIIHTATNEIVEQSADHVTEMIQKGVQKEMAAISEQVYRKLEQRLRTERSRRGY